LIVEDGKSARAAPSDRRDDGTIEIEDEQGKPAKADVVLVARQFLRESKWVFRSSHIDLA
jgi:hypothetical protein